MLAHPQNLKKVKRLITFRFKFDCSNLTKVLSRKTNGKFKTLHNIHIVGIKSKKNTSFGTLYDYDCVKIAK